MKSSLLIPALLFFAAILSASPSNGADITGSYAVSPDHPSTWTSGADNVHQSLRWDASKKMLFAEVKFSTVGYSSDASPTEIEDYSLSFPTVRFDSQSKRFTAGGVEIGTLRDGLFGSEVALDKNVELDVHLFHHGKIYASINRVQEE